MRNGERKFGGAEWRDAVEGGAARSDRGGPSPESAAPEGAGTKWSTWSGRKVAERARRSILKNAAEPGSFRGERWAAKGLTKA